MNSIVITGGFGFLGSLVAHKLDQQNKVIKFGHPNKYEDITDIASVLNFFMAYQPNEVIHAAALKNIVESEKNVQKYIDVNVIGTSNVIKSAISSGVEKFTFISSIESDRPISVYGATKLLGEKLIGEVNSKQYRYVRLGTIIGGPRCFIRNWNYQIKNNDEIKITNLNMVKELITAEKAANEIIAGQNLYQKNYFTLYQIIDVLQQINNKYAKIKIVGLRKGEPLRNKSKRLSSINTLYNMLEEIKL